MRYARIAAILIATLSLVTVEARTAAAQAWRGVGRISGKVVDESGQGIPDVQISGTKEGVSGAAKTKTNKKGEWSIVGIGGGHWHLEFAKQGFQSGTFDMQANEQSPNAPINTTLKKAAVDPNAVIQQDLAKAGDLMKQQKWADARQIYEDILQKYPQVYQVEPYIARTYYEEKNYDQAIAHLQNLLAKDPENLNAKLLEAQIYGQKGDAAKSQEVIASIDDSKITDPTIMLNVAIGMLNDKKPADAMTWLDKTITRFPNYADGYYYRGLCDIQLEKNDQAKADLSKFVQMAPNAPEAATAKGILEKLK